jgi:hypothetical protein
MKDDLDIMEMTLPDLSGHPPPLHLSFEQYQQWIFGEIVPELARRGEMTEEKLIADFMRNEGRMREFRF